jgi:hypothetical protein
MANHVSRTRRTCFCGKCSARQQVCLPRRHFAIQRTPISPSSAAQKAEPRDPGACTKGRSASTRHFVNLLSLATRHLLTLLQPPDGEYPVQRRRAGESGGQEQSQISKAYHSPLHNAGPLTGNEAQ